MIYTYRYNLNKNNLLRYVTWYRDAHVLLRSYTSCMSNIEVPAVSSTTITYTVIQNGRRRVNILPPWRTRSRALGALTTIVRWRRRADLFNENWFVKLRPWTTLAHVSFDLGSRLQRGTKNRSLVLSRRERHRIYAMFQILWTTEDNDFLEIYCYNKTKNISLNKIQ